MYQACIHKDGTSIVSIAGSRVGSSPRVIWHYLLVPKMKHVTASLAGLRKNIVIISAPYQ